MQFHYKTDLHRYKRYYQSLEGIVSRPAAHVYTTAIFSFLAVSLFGWYAIRPTIQTILFLRREIEDNRKVNKQMEEKIANLIEAHNTYQSVTADLPVLAQALPETADVLSALGQIEHIVSIHGASISAMTGSSSALLPKSQSPEKKPVPTKTPSGTVEAVPLGLTIVGTYEDLLAIIEDIVSLRRIVSIESIAFTLNRDRQGWPLKLVLKLNTHYYE